MKRLQVLMDDKWVYVFCYNGQTNKLITTEERNKAVDERGLEFFSNKYSNNTFRVK